MFRLGVHTKIFRLSEEQSKASSVWEDVDLFPMGKKKERQRKLPPSTSFVLYVIMSLSTEQRGLIVLALGIASL